MTDQPPTPPDHRKAALEALWDALYEYANDGYPDIQQAAIDALEAVTPHIRAVVAYELEAESERVGFAETPDFHDGLLTGADIARGGTR